MKSMELDIKRLIEVAEDIAADEQIGFAAQIRKPVQILIDEDGNRYGLDLVLTALK